MVNWGKPQTALEGKPLDTNGPAFDRWGVDTFDTFDTFEKQKRGGGVTVLRVTRLDYKTSET